MRCRGFHSLFGCIAFSVVSLLATAVAADERIVPAAPGSLTKAIAEARAGDILRLRPGDHSGPVAIDRPLNVVGEPARVLSAPDPAVWLPSPPPM